MLLPSEYSRGGSYRNSDLKSREIQVLSSCNRQPRLSSASRGVRSRPPQEGILMSSYTEMIPHLTPLMQSDLTKESSITLKKRLNSIVDGESNDQNFPVWEENFQDLSGWCMDQFPEQCDFPIGETINPKLTGNDSLTMFNQLNSVCFNASTKNNIFSRLKNRERSLNYGRSTRRVYYCLR